MRTVDLMGPKALTFIDYVGWLKTSDGYKHLLKGNYYLRTINKAQTHLSQPWDKHMFVRPEEPWVEPPGVTVDGIEMDGYGDEEHEVWVKWRPMFTGSWRYDDDADAIIYEPESGGEYWLYCYDYKGWSLDAFIRDLTKDDVPLFYHPEHELQ